MASIYRMKLGIFYFVLHYLHTADSILGGNFILQHFQMHPLCCFRKICINSHRHSLAVDLCFPDECPWAMQSEVLAETWLPAAGR